MRKILNHRLGPFSCIPSGCLGHQLEERAVAATILKFRSYDGICQPDPNLKHGFICLQHVDTSLVVRLRLMINLMILIKKSLTL